MRRRLNFGDAERKEMEHGQPRATHADTRRPPPTRAPPAPAPAGNFSMVDGLLTPAVLAHIIRYGLYRDFPPAAPAAAGATSIAAAAEARGISPPPQ